MVIAVRVKCKKCSRDAKSDEFVLDPVYKMMVCQQCVKDRRMNEMAQKKAASQEANRAKVEEQKKQMPAGWDSEDNEIERAYNNKLSQKSVIERIDDDKVKYTCKKCKYTFTYSTVQNKPGRCPYCGTPVQI